MVLRSSGAGATAGAGAGAAPGAAPRPGPPRPPVAAPPLKKPMWENLSRLAMVTDAVCMPPIERPAMALCSLSGSVRKFLSLHGINSAVMNCPYVPPPGPPIPGPRPAPAAAGPPVPAAVLGGAAGAGAPGAAPGPRSCTAGGRSPVHTRSATRSVGSTRCARLHDDNHRLYLPRSKQVVENHVRPAHLDPHPLVFATAVLKIENRVALLEIDVVPRRRVDENMAPGIGCLGEVILDQHIAVRHVLDVIEIHARLGDLKAVAHVAVTDECLSAGIHHDRAIHDHPVVVITGGLRRAGVGPHSVGAFCHVKRNIDDGDLHLLRGGRVEVKSHPIVGFNSRKLNAREVVG